MHSVKKRERKEMVKKRGEEYFRKEKRGRSDWRSLPLSRNTRLNVLFF